MLTDQDVRKIMEESRALLTGHFKLSSGRHSGNYLQCAQALQYPDKAETLCRELAARWKAERVSIDCVASPAVGGVVIGQEVARALGVRAIFSERDGEGKMTFRRGFKIQPGETVLLADDVLTTGLSLRELSALVEQEGGIVAGLSALAERGFHEKNFPVVRKTLLKLDFQDYAPDDCPLCEQGIPVEKPGSRPGAAASGKAGK